MAKVFLHVGLHKTGSSLLQSLFFKIHQKGRINYLGKFNTDFDFEQIKDKHYKKKAQLYEELMREKLKLVGISYNPEFLDNIQEYKKQFDSLLVENQINVISDEDFSGLHNDLLFKILCKLLEGHSVKVFIVLRKQSEYLYSFYIQNSPWLQDNGYPNFEDFIQSLQAGSDFAHYHQKIKKYKENFGNISIDYLEKLKSEPNKFYQNLSHLLGIEIPQEEIQTTKENISLKNKKGTFINPIKILYHSLSKFEENKVLKNERISIFFLSVVKIFLLLCNQLIQFFLGKKLTKLKFVIEKIEKKYNYSPISKEEYAHFSNFKENLTPFPPLTKKEKIKFKFFKYFYFQKNYKKELIDIFNERKESILIPHLEEKEKQNIFDMCKKENLKLAEKKFCSKEDLEKYGYI